MELVYCLELPDLKFYPAKMQKNFTQTAQQLFLEQKDCVMKTATTIQENAEDIYAGAQQINEERAAAAEAAAFEDAAEEAAEEAEETTEETAAEETAEETAADTE